MVNINKYIKSLLHRAGGNQGSHKAHQAGKLAETHLEGSMYVAKHPQVVNTLSRPHTSIGIAWYMTTMLL